jgi:hypothetical protein
MGRSKEYKSRVAITAYLESEEFAALEEIRWRERKDITQVVRAAVVEFVKAHGSGNDSFKLDNWQDDPEFQAVPTILAEKEKWDSYLEECNDEELTKIAISAKQILSKVHYCRYGVYRRV